MSRIVIVDDEQTVLQSLEVLLSTEGHEVVSFRDSRLAADAVRNESFDLLITDIRMTPVNGLELIRLARERNPALPCLVVSAYNSKESVEACFAAGCRSFFPKPYRLQEVVDAVQAALNPVATS